MSRKDHYDVYEKLKVKDEVDEYVPRTYDDQFYKFKKNFSLDK